MQIIEVNEMRRIFTMLAPGVDFDSSFTFYYDETNNIRKFYVRKEDFNSPFESNFVLGGLVYQGAAPNLNPLFEGLNLQKSIKEVKLKHIAKGEFLECLASKNLKYFLKYLRDNSLYVHYSSINILYYSLVDIVDSAILSSEAAMKLGEQFARLLKNDLYKLAVLEIDSIIDIFYKYEYPNIKKDSVESFIEEITFLIEKHAQDPEFHFGLQALRRLLKEAKKKKSLAFIMDEKDFILLADFSVFYLRQIYLFKNSNHIFDNEESIAEHLNNIELKDGQDTVKPYSFMNSHGDLFIQASDIFVGLIGKLSRFINTNSLHEITEQLKTLTEMQRENFRLLLEIIKHSDDKNIGFFHSVESIEGEKKWGLIWRMARSW